MCSKMENNKIMRIFDFIVNFIMYYEIWIILFGLKCYMKNFFCIYIEWVILLIVININL